MAPKDLATTMRKAVKTAMLGRCPSSRVHSRSSWRPTATAAPPSKRACSMRSADGASVATSPCSLAWWILGGGVCQGGDPPRRQAAARRLQRLARDLHRACRLSQADALSTLGKRQLEAEANVMRAMARPFVSSHAGAIARRVVAALGNQLAKEIDSIADRGAPRSRSTCPSRPRRRRRSPRTRGGAARAVSSA